MSSGNKIALWVAVIGTIAIILAAIIQIQPWKTNHEKKSTKIKDQFVLAGSVIDEKTNSSIGQAEVSIVGRNEQYYTEQNGNFKIHLSDTSLKDARIRVTKIGYKAFDKSFNIPSEEIIIQLSEN